MICKIHETPNSKVLGCCDFELLGKTLTHGDAEIIISKFFFGDKKINEKELIELLEEADSINLIGKKCTSIAIANGFAVQEQVIIIKDVPHIQIYKFR